MEFLKIKISEISEKRELRESSDDTLGSLLGSLFISNDEDDDIVETVTERVGSLLKIQKVNTSHDEWLKFEEDNRSAKALMDELRSKYKISEELMPHLTPTFNLYEEGTIWEHKTDSVKLPLGIFYVGIHRGMSKNHYVVSKIPQVIRDWDYKLKGGYLAMNSFRPAFKNPVENLELINVLDHITIL